MGKAKGTVSPNSKIKIECTKKMYILTEHDHRRPTLLPDLNGMEHEQ